MKRHKNQKGFSLIELLVVVAIILIIAAIAIPNLLKAKASAQQAAAGASVKSLAASMHLYHADQVPGTFAGGTLSVLGTNGKYADAGWAASANRNGFTFGIADALVNDFVVTAKPTDTNVTGPSYCSTADGTVRTTADNAAGSASAAATCEAIPTVVGQ